MGQKPDPWDVQTEFIPLLKNHALDHVQVNSEVLPGRESDAIETVREAICDAHGLGKSAGTALNEACKAHLADEAQPEYTCWKCGTLF